MPTRTWLFIGIGIVGLSSLALIRLSADRTRSLPKDHPPISSASRGEATPLAPIDTARLRSLETEIARDSTRLPALLEAGHLYLTLQQFDQSARVSMKALAVDSNAAEAHTHLGMILWAGHDPHLAMQALDRALAINPAQPEALLYRGLILFVQLRNFPAAADAFERYLRVAPSGADTLRVRSMLDDARRQAAAAP